MNALPKGYEAAARQHDNASPDEGVPDHVIDDAMEVVFDECDGPELAALLHDALPVLSRVARGEPVGVSDDFARLIAEAQRIRDSVDACIARQMKTLADEAEDMRGEAEFMRRYG